MALLKSQIKELLQKPINKVVIAKALRHEKRLQFHIDTNMDAADANAVINEYLAWVKLLIPNDKYLIFLQLFKFPVPTNELIEDIYTALEKVYDGKDAYDQYDFLSTDFLTDWQVYRTDVLNAQSFWRNEAFRYSKTNVNGFMIVDLKETQNSVRPEPYFYFLPISQVYDFKYTQSGSVEWIMFMQGDAKMAVFDDEYYRVFNIDEKNELIGEPIIEESHDLGYCPASLFWSDRLKNSDAALKKSPISNQLSNLDWLLFFQTSKKHLDLYAPYPIYSGFEQECDYDNNAGDYCDSGFIKNSSAVYYTDRSGGLTKCPVCSDKRLAGVGSFIEVPLPSRDNDNADLRNPIQITSIDKASLDYNVEESNRLSKKIYSSVVGNDGDVQMGKAYNTDQIKANNDALRNVLVSFKKNFEVIQGWVDDTICRLRYGTDYKGSTIQKGTDFYLYSTEDLTKQYNDAKTAGATDYQLDFIQDQINETEFRENPRALSRIEVLKNIEPYRHQTRTEVLDMKAKSFGDNELIAVKLNFSTFVLRFERENTNVVDFGSDLQFDTKIDIIIKTLKEYGKSEHTADSGTGS